RAPVPGCRPDWLRCPARSTGRVPDGGWSSPAPALGVLVLGLVLVGVLRLRLVVLLVVLVLVLVLVLGLVLRLVLGFLVPRGLVVGLALVLLVGAVGLVLVPGFVVVPGFVLVLRLVLGSALAVALVAGGLVLLLLLLGDRVLVALHDLAIADLTAPAVLRLALDGDEAGEVLQVEPGPAALGAPDVAGLLEEPRGVVLDDQQHPREVLAEGVEGADALGRALGSLRGPRDAVVGDLLGGLRLPAAVGPPGLGLPVRGGVVGLVGTLAALGEGAEVLVVRPLVEGGAERHPDVDLLDDDGGLLAGGALALALPSAATEPLQSAHDVVLGTGGAHLDGAAQGALALGDLAASVECEPGEAGAVALGDVVQLVGGLPELVADSGQQAGGLRREVLLHLGLEAVGGLAVGEVGERVLLLPVASRA